MAKPLPKATLFGRLALAMFISFILIGVFSVALFTRASGAYQQEISQRMHRGLAQYVVDHYVFFDQGKPKLEAIKQSFHNLMILGPNIEFYLLDNAGNIMAFSAEASKIKRTRVRIKPVETFLKGNPAHPVFGDDPRSTSRQKVFSAAPILVADQPVGYLYAIIGSEIYDDIAGMVSQSRIIQWGIWLLTMGLSFSLISMLWVTGLITRPLARLTSQVARMQRQGFNEKTTEDSALLAELQQWPKNSHNEIDQLGSAFASLLETLSQEYKNVLTVDQLRKELLSHVSHDLRTPLASLLGYLETWELNRQQLSDTQSSEYIAIARKSAERISRLVEQLFELAHLDSGTVQVNREPFSLPELVQDVLQKFAIASQEKHILLDVEPKDSRIIVVGDIEKLERVFTNLVENAIRHTNAGGSVLVRLCTAQQFVSVEVTDTGVGIPAEDVAHVFEPHFKAGNSVRGNTAHGGLGLAITKKLLALHHSNIYVRSQVNRGTTFEFQLEAAVNSG